MIRCPALLLRLCRQERGLALIEFAFVLPILLTLYMAGYQISEAIACNRKVTIAARAVADLTSQYSLISASQVDTVLGASAKVMAPYDVSQALVRVSEITTDTSNNSKVVWSRALNGSPRVTGSAFTYPSSMMKISGTYFIYAEVIYNYVPAASFGFVGPKTLSQTIYMLPRTADNVNCTDCT